MSSKMLEQLDLSQSSLCENLLGEHIGHFLDSNPFASLSIGSRALAQVSMGNVECV